MSTTQITKKVALSSKTTLKSKGFFHELIKNKILFLMLLPGTIILIINNYLPMLGIFIAFKDVNYTKGFFRSDWVGFKNFEYFIKSTYAFVITRNTLLYNLVFIFLGLAVSATIAIALNELVNQKLKKIYQSVIFIPFFMSWIVISYIGYAFLGMDLGFINKTLVNVFHVEGVQWYFEQKYWPFILTFANLWKYTGYNSVIYLAAITNISSEYYEAAAIDGATKWQQIIKITIPQIKPLMVIMTLLAVGRIFNADFGLFYTFTMNSGAIYDVTQVMDTFVYRSMTTGVGDVGMASAAGFFQSVVGFVCVFTSNYIVKKIDPEKALF